MSKLFGSSLSLGLCSTFNISSVLHLFTFFSRINMRLLDILARFLFVHEWVVCTVICNLLNEAHLKLRVVMYAFDCITCNLSDIREIGYFHQQLVNSDWILHHTLLIQIVYTKQHRIVQLLTNWTLILVSWKFIDEKRVEIGIMIWQI